MLDVETDNEEISSPEEIEELKSKAVKADFVEINSGKTEEGSKLYLEGEIGVIEGTDVFDKFALTTREGDGYGVYDVINLYKTNWILRKVIMLKYGVFTKEKMRRPAYP